MANEKLKINHPSSKKKKQLAVNFLRDGKVGVGPSSRKLVIEENHFLLSPFS